jgi:hypothetical protein
MSQIENQFRLTNRWSQPLSDVLKAGGGIMKDEVKAKLAPASGGLSPSR